MFGISLSGLNASQKYLDVTSNNISNSNSYGFKRSRAEFADIYSNNIFSSVKTNVGMGVLTATVAQQFAQGSLTGDTGNNLDMAINGNGFFVLSPQLNDASGTTYDGARTYTRNGAFELTKDGYVVTAQGDYLQVYDLNSDDRAANLDVSATHALQIPSTTGAPKMSTNVSIGVNLPANTTALAESAYFDGTNWHDGYYSVQQFDPKNSETYSGSTSQTIHDSLGGAHTLTYYFLKDHTNDGQTVTPTGTADTDVWGGTTPDGHTIWNVLVYVDGNPVDIANSPAINSTDATSNGGAWTITDKNSSIYHETGGTPDNTFYGFQLEFDTSGQLLATGGMTPSALYIVNNGSDNPPETGREDHSLSYAMGGGVDNTQNLHLALSTTQYGSSSFTVSQTPTDDGYSTGELTNVSVDENGVVLAEYSNGRQVHLAKVALADFVNPQGLLKIGDTQWKESNASGQPRPLEANFGTAGTIKGANLEMSNVDLTSQLVDLIIAQRSYQANAQSLQTQNTVMDAILGIR
ncbi:MAG: flagellar hook protein FlgE [Succinivibrio sp.]|nr:flagellar hook protein FlgE [Succinivibrio sp.]